MITDAQEFFARGCGRCERFDTPDCSAQRWREGLAAVRALCLQAGLQETAKWGHPCYMHAGRNVAILGATRGDFRLNFFGAALLSDPDGQLERQGPNTQHPDALRFTDAADAERRAPVVLALLQEAMAHAAAGRRPPKTTAALELPQELAEALQADLVLATAFAALTPGRQKSYVLHVLGTQNPATRRSRIERCRDKILAGKGQLER